MGNSWVGWIPSLVLRGGVYFWLFHSQLQALGSSFHCAVMRGSHLRPVFLSRAGLLGGPQALNPTSSC